MLLTNSNFTGEPVDIPSSAKKIDKNPEDVIFTSGQIKGEKRAEYINKCKTQLYTHSTFTNDLAAMGRVSI